MAMAVTVPRYTVDELEHFPDDGNRYELLDGVLLVTPAPEQVHQLVAGRLHGTLYHGLRGALARVASPGVVTRPPGTQLQPDVLVYPARFAATARWMEISEYWLAIEIFSPSSRVYDRQFKRDAYLALGVQQVWLVDIEDRSIDVCRPRQPRHVARDAIHWSVPGTDLVVTIDLAEVFAEIP